MSLIPFVRPWRHASLVVAFVDFQREYLTPGRPYSIRESERCLDNSRGWLAAARSWNLPIAHFRQYRNENVFNQHSAFANWIDGFRPRPNEPLYERNQPSCYANLGFAEFINQITDPLIILAGLSGDQACLATALDASSRIHRLIFLSDCSATPSLGDLSEAQSHKAVCHIIERYADVVTVKEIAEQMTARSMLRTSA